jgi:hypothetical protein
MKGSRSLRMLLAGALLAAALGSCGGEADDTVQFDSNTNWLKSCSVDDECGGALSCLCGICTQPCGTNPECRLLSQAECRPSESPHCAGAPNVDVGGVCVLPCESDNACPVLFTCAAGQCIPPDPVAVHGIPPGSDGDCAFISWDDLYESVELDVLSEDAAARPYLRYITLANNVDAGLCSDARMNDARQAMSKLLNSLSWRTAIRQPTPIIAGTETYRIDLRDYGWNFEMGPVLGEFFQYDDRWEALITNSPYAIEFEGDAAENIILQTETTVPVLFADVFLAAALDSTSLYYGLADIPADLGGLHTKLNVDIEQDRAEELALRAGFSQGGRDVLSERHPQRSRAGLYYWQTTDFGTSPALVNDPLGALTGDAEVVFTLPNGLLSFAIFNGNGLRSEDQSLSFRLPEGGGEYTIPRSAFGAVARGFAVTDTVRERVLGNAGAYSPEVIQGVRATYPSAQELRALLAQDAAVYRTALGLAGVDPEGNEPIEQTVVRFNGDVFADNAAGDLMYPRDRFLIDVPRLDPALSGLDDGFAVDRRDWSSLYLESLCIFGVGNENQPTDAECATIGL